MDTWVLINEDWYYEVDGSKPDRPRVATATDGSGQIMFIYSGRLAGALG